MLALLSTLLLTADPLLFLTPDAMENAQGIELRAQTPVETEALLRPDPGAAVWYMPVAALPLEGKTGIWYQPVEKTQPEYLDQRVLCLGLYANGEWILPAVNLDLVSWGGLNNVVLRRSPYTPTWGGFNQHQIVKAADGFRMLFWDQPAEQGEAGAMLATSPDGIRWEKDPRGAVFTEHNDAFTLLPMDGAYLLYQTKLEDWPDKPYVDNLPNLRRVQSLRESKDLITWTPQDVFLRPDEQDPPETEFYLMKAFPYGGRYAGILMKYFADPKTPNKHGSATKHELVLSDDARHWQRPFRDTDLGFFSFANPFLDGGRLCFASWKEGGIVLFKYRPNRLIGATATEGELTTPPLTFRRPALDADTSNGSIEATLLDEAGAPIPGTAPSTVKDTDAESIALPFEDVVHPYRLRLRLKNATLYAIHEK